MELYIPTNIEIQTDRLNRRVWLIFLNMSEAILAKPAWTSASEIGPYLDPANSTLKQAFSVTFAELGASKGYDEK